MDRITKIIMIFCIFLIVTDVFIVSKNYKYVSENKTLRIHIDSLTKKIDENPPIKETDVLLNIYEESYLELLKKHPDCARKYSEIMSKYE